ncbi:hypothetical protein K3G39_03905 [Pontibacter sp. HSC-14F20]|uniref:hypothetical protein n=1 Tax=Pontibacter sp. HSC-14F20 TaxID=2864136 RepID=UPI001C736992|nr:hypothetical protein [Pontibacter sp. HSC-14F20]MBX0332373.1 hypothetical protein [Pontibacter sp. HSC-14F20]
MNQKLFPIGLVVFFLLFDMFDGFYKDDQIFAAIRYIIPLSLMVVYLFAHGGLRKSDSIFLVLFVYLGLLTVYIPGDIILSVKTTLAILAALLMILIGREIGEKRNFLQEFEKYNRYLLILIPVYIIYANIFNVGRSYAETFTTGFLTTSRMYIAPLLIFLGVHYIFTNKNRGAMIKLFDIALILFNIALLIVITRRTSLVMIVGALFVYMLLNRQLIFKMVILVFCLIAALIFSYPLYEAKLAAQLEKRERIQDLETYEEEGRYLETLFIIDYHDKREDPLELLFGVKLWDTFSFGIKYFGRDRPIHSDINMIFYSTGLFGLLLFTLFFIHYFLLGNARIIPENRKAYYPLLAMFVMVLLPGRFIGTFTYAPLLMLLLSAIKHYKPIEEVKEAHNEKEKTVFQEKLLEQNV